MSTVTLERNGRIVTAGPAELITEDREVAWAQDLIRHNPLYAWVLGRYVTAGEANANGHIFAADELRTQAPSLVHAPLNMLHRPHDVLGTYVGAELVYPVAAAAQGGGNPIVESLAVLWRYYFEDEYAIVKMAHDAGLLAQSMECIPKTVTCATAQGCGVTFAYAGRASDTYCDHINAGADRKLNMPHFSAGALVIPPKVPAWRGAKVTQLSAQLRTAEVEGLAASLYDQVRTAMPHLDESGREQFMAAVMSLSGPSSGSTAPRTGSKDAPGPKAGPHAYAEPPGMPAGDGPCTVCGKPADSPVHHGMGDPAATDAADVPKTAAMVALYPPSDVAATLALGGGFADALSPTDLHVTLAYLGPTATKKLDRDAVIAALAPVAARAQEMRGWVSGIGRFSAGYPNGQDSWPLYASIDLPPLPEFRQEIVEALDAAGLPVARDHGYSPHLTLAYIGPPDENAAAQLLAAGVAPMALTFGDVVLAWGEERIVIPLGGADDEDSADPVAAIIERARHEAASVPVWDPRVRWAFSADERATMTRTGAALPDGSLPIAHSGNLVNAIRTWRADRPNAAAEKRHITARAMSMSAGDMLPVSW